MCIRMKDHAIKLDESRDAEAMLDEAFPVTELVLKFTSADEHGNPTELVETIKGEDAEYLPHIMARIEAFLGQAGFSTSMTLGDTEVDRLSDALHNLIVLDHAA